jgi:hypothetical protein
MESRTVPAAVSLQRAVMHTQDVQEAIAKGGLAIDVGGSLLSALTSTWRQLRGAVSKMTASKEDRELLSLMEFAASRYGEPLLSSANVDDLDDRIDSLLASPEVSQLNALLLRMGIPTMRRASKRKEVGSFEDFARAVEGVLGEAQSRAIQCADPIFSAWLGAQNALMENVPDAAIADAEAFAASAHDFLTSAEVPLEYAEALASRLRAEFCFLAIASAVVREVAVEPWRGRALVERLIAGARGHLRFLASLPGVDVPESIVPLSERLDFASIEERHRRSRVRADETLQRVRLRHSSAL